MALSESQARLTAAEAAKWIVVYKNGDEHYAGRRMVVKPREIKTFDHLLEEVTVKLSPSFGAVRHIFTPEGGTRVASLTELKPNGQYVASPNGPFRQLSRTRYTDLPVQSTSHSHDSLHTSKDKLAAGSRRLRAVPSRYRDSAADDITVHVHRNGDAFVAPSTFQLNKMARTHWEHTLTRMSDKLHVGRGVHKLYTLKGQLVRDPVTELEHNAHYVAAADNEHFRLVNYGAALEPFQSVTRGDSRPRLSPQLVCSHQRCGAAHGVQRGSVTASWVPGYCAGCLSSTQPETAAERRAPLPPLPPLSYPDVASRTASLRSSLAARREASKQKQQPQNEPSQEYRAEQPRQSGVQQSEWSQEAAPQGTRQDVRNEFSLYMGMYPPPIQHADTSNVANDVSNVDAEESANLQSSVFADQDTESLTQPTDTSDDEGFQRMTEYMVSEEEADQLGQYPRSEDESEPLSHYPQSEEGSEQRGYYSLSEEASDSMLSYLDHGADALPHSPIYHHPSQGIQPVTEEPGNAAQAPATIDGDDVPQFLTELIARAAAQSSAGVPATAASSNSASHLGREPDTPPAPATEQPAVADSDQGLPSPASPVTPASGEAPRRLRFGRRVDVSGIMSPNSVTACSPEPPESSAEARCATPPSAEYRVQYRVLAPRPAILRAPVSGGESPIHPEGGGSTQSPITENGEAPAVDKVAHAPPVPTDETALPAEQRLMREEAALRRPSQPGPQPQPATKPELSSQPEAGESQDRQHGWAWDETALRPADEDGWYGRQPWTPPPPSPSPPRVPRDTWRGCGAGLRPPAPPTDLSDRPVWPPTMSGSPGPVGTASAAPAWEPGELPASVPAQTPGVDTTPSADLGHKLDNIATMLQALLVQNMTSRSAAPPQLSEAQLRALLTPRAAGREGGDGGGGQHQPTPRSNQ